MIINTTAYNHSMQSTGVHHARDALYSLRCHRWEDAQPRRRASRECAARLDHTTTEACQRSCLRAAPLAPNRRHHSC